MLKHYPLATKETYIYTHTHICKKYMHIDNNFYGMPRPLFIITIIILSFLKNVRLDKVKEWSFIFFWDYPENNFLGIECTLYLIYT